MSFGTRYNPAQGLAPDVRVSESPDLLRTSLHGSITFDDAFSAQFHDPAPAEFRPIPTRAEYSLIVDFSTGASFGSGRLFRFSVGVEPYKRVEANYH